MFKLKLSHRLSDALWVFRPLKNTYPPIRGQMSGLIGVSWQLEKQQVHIAAVIFGQDFKICLGWISLGYSFRKEIIKL